MGFMSDFGGIISGLLNFAGSENLQDQAQGFSAYQAGQQMQFQERMRGSQYQTAVADMMAAGLNPMLAYHQGGAGTPAGAAGSSPGASMPALDISSGAELENKQTLNKVYEAQADKIRAEAEEIRQRTPTHAVSIDHMKQQINESVERIQEIHQRIRTGISSAANLDQQTVNLREQIPQIRAMTNQLRTLSNLQQAQAVEVLTRSGLNEAQATEILQRVKENLPRLEAQLMNLERITRDMSMPGHQADEAARGSLVGQIGAYLKALIPLQGVMGAIPMGKLGTKAPKPGEPLKFPRDTHR